MQLRRAKGWRKPEGCIVVSRPSRWGNPFTMEHGREAAVASFAAMVVDRRAGRRPERDYPSDAEIRAELAGHDLACWCPLDAPCHADVLLAIANGP